MIGAAVAFISTSFLTSGYTLTQTLFLKAEKLEITQEENIDLQHLSDTVSAIITSPDFQSSLTPNVHLVAKKIAPQVITISTTTPTLETTKQVQVSAIQKFNSNANQWTNNVRMELVPIGSPQEPAKRVLNNKILAIFGALLGTISAFTIISVSRYFKL